MGYCRKCTKFASSACTKANGIMDIPKCWFCLVCRAIETLSYSQIYFTVNILLVFHEAPELLWPVHHAYSVHHVYCYVTFMLTLVIFCTLILIVYTLRSWNSLPHNIASSNSILTFTQTLLIYLHCYYSTFSWGVSFFQFFTAFMHPGVLHVCKHAFTKLK